LSGQFREACAILRQRLFQRGARMPRLDSSEGR
jgi:hypothetical protein